MGLFDLIGRGQSDRTALQSAADIILTLAFASIVIYGFYSCDKKHEEFANSPEQVELRKQNELNQLRKRITELEQK